MRSALLACLAVTATLTSAFAPSIAEACGGYMPDPAPQVFAVVTHSVSVEGKQDWVSRSFVMLNPTQRPNAKWRQLAPDSFDQTQVANELTAKDSTTMTLVGPAGTMVVSSQRHALIAKGWGDRKNVFSTLEVNTGEESQFQIALAGTQPDAKWINVSETKTRSSTKAWLKAQGIEATSIYSSLVDGTYIQVISAYQEGGQGLASFVRMGNRSLGQYTGAAIGALELGGKKYVLFESNGLITPVPV